MASPLVSIIIPAYNAEKYIGETIESALNQSFADFELIIVEDGSTDNTRAVIDSYCDPRIVVFPQANAGVAAARNRGIKAARGAYIALLDNDDLWVPHCLETAVRFLEDNPEVSIAFSDSLFFGESKFAGRRFQEVYPPSAPITFAKFASRESNIPICAIFRREVFEKVGYFDVKIHGAEDFDFWLRALRAGCRIEPIREVLTYYRRHAAAVSIMKGAVQRGALLALDKWRDNPALSQDERDAVEATYKDIQWIADAHDAVFHICQQKYDLAREDLRRACAHKAKWRYRVARIGLAVTPGIVHYAVRAYRFCSSLRRRRTAPPAIPAAITASGPA
jgi:glycosyltransferase involved in cell wall biosynthesis